MKLYAWCVRIVYLITRPLSGLFLHNSHRVRVLITSGEEVLLQRSSFGHQLWSLPGGGIKRSEGIEHAAVREVQEEVGLTLKPGQIVQLPEYSQPAPLQWPAPRLQFCSVKLTKKPQVRIARPLEVLEVGWFPLNDLPENLSETVETALRLRELNA